jgi:O-antigen/teichoic acid export membrane protein
VGKAFGGRWLLLVALVFGSATSAAVYLARGLLGGSRRFGGYAATLAVEGLARLVPCIAVALAGVQNAGLYALLFAAGSGVATLAGLPALRRSSHEAAVENAGSAVSTATMARASAVLAGSTLLAQLVANLAPVVVSGRLAADTATAAAFASAFVLVRVPLFVFAPVQAMLLPTLTAAATRSDLAEVRRKLRLILAAVAVVGVLGALLSFVLGPWAARVFFGAKVTLPGVVLGVLGLGTFALMIAQVLQPALVAMGLHRAATVSWLAGSAVLTGLLFLPGDPLRAAMLAQLIGSVLVVAGMSTALSAAIRAKRVT